MEYNHPEYARRRHWRALSLCAPSLELNPDAVYENSDGTFAANLDPYPFSVKPDKLLSLPDIFSIYRDHYEGTRFDLTRPVIDPWGNPNRYNTHGYDAGGDVGTEIPKGAWERPISHYYTGYAFVNTPNKDAPEGLKGVTWMALNVPGESCFIPLNVSEYGEFYSRADTSQFNIQKAWWVFNRVAEECYRKYSFIKPDIIEQQNKDEKASLKLWAHLADKYGCPCIIPPINTNIDSISNELKDNATKVIENWRKLWYGLIVKYNQGFKFENQDAYTLGYPADWLEKSEWKDGPTSYDQPYNGKWKLTTADQKIEFNLYCQVVIAKVTDTITGNEDNQKLYIRFKDNKYLVNITNTSGINLLYELRYIKDLDILQLTDITNDITYDFTRIIP